MVSAALGDSISDAEVTNVSGHGLWILVSGEELFLPFDKFPWFRDAPIGKATNVERPQPHHLYRPDLDVDLHVDSIRNPDHFPLMS
jgi:hypothetical protein